MKAEVHILHQQPNQVTFPCLAMHKQTGEYFLFTAPGVGTLLQSDTRQLQVITDLPPLTDGCWYRFMAGDNITLTQE